MIGSDGARLEFAVGPDDTAVALGSGSLPVLGTPRLLAWCEAATCSAIEAALGVGQTSVGTRVRLDHLAASPVGAAVSVAARQVYADGRLVRFAVTATQAPDDKVVGEAEVTRVIVDVERFLSRLS